MRLDQITFTRFVAALTVIFFHYGNQAFPLNIPYLNAVLTAGPIAVNYFFLLSGFIMAIAYYQPHNTNFSAKKYWLARFARIYPVYLLALLLVAASKLKTPDFATALSLNLSLLQAWIPQYALSLNAPGWSLSVEAFFYLCFPALLFLIYRLSLKQIAMLGLLIWLATQLILLLALNSDSYQAKNALHNFIYYNPLMHINAFILGVVAGVIFKARTDLLTFAARYSTTGILLTTLALAALIAFKDSIAQITGFRIAFTNGLLAPLFLLFIVFLALNKGAISRAFSHPWLVLLGEASFSLYILQRPVHSLYEKTIAHFISLPDSVHFYIYLCLLILISIASYKLFETPARRFIRAFGKPGVRTTAPLRSPTR